MPSFYIPLSGLDADSTALNTIANNLSNMNTTGFKAQTTNFSDLFYQEVGTTGSGDEIQAGTGVQVASNSTDFSGGPVSSTGVSTDAAINGSGFFVLDDNGSQLYTRDGNFQTSASGTLESTQGQAVMGYMALKGVINTGAGLSDITIPTGQVMQPSATTSFNMTQSLDSASPVGTQVPGQVQVFDSLGKAYEATVTYTNLGDNKWSYAVTLPDALTAAAATPAASATMPVTVALPSATSVTAATTAVETSATVPMPVSAATALAQSTNQTLTPDLPPKVAPTTNPAVVVNVDTTTVPGTTTTNYTFAATGSAGVGSTLQFTFPAATPAVPTPSAGESLINYAQALQTAVGLGSGVTIQANSNVLSISGLTGSYTTSGTVTQDVTESATNYHLATSNGAIAQVAPSTNLTVQIGNGAVISAPAFATNEPVATYAAALQAAVNQVVSGVTINGSNMTGVLSITGPSNLAIGGNLVQNFSATQTNFAVGSYTDPTTGLVTQAGVDPSTSLTFRNAQTATGGTAPDFTVTPSIPTGESLATYVGDIQAALTTNNVAGVTVTGKNGVLSISGPSGMSITDPSPNFGPPIFNQDTLGTIVGGSVTPTSPVTLTSTIALPAAPNVPASSSTTTLTASAPTITATSGMLLPDAATVPSVSNGALTATIGAGSIAYTLTPTGEISCNTVLKITDSSVPANILTITPPTDMTPFNFAAYVNGRLGNAVPAAIALNAVGVNGTPATNTNGSLTIAGAGISLVATPAGVQQDVQETTTNYNLVTSNGALATVDPATTNLTIQIAGAAPFVPPPVVAGELITKYASDLQAALPMISGVTVTAALNAQTGLPTGLLSITGPANMTVSGNLGQNFNANNLVYDFGATGTVSTASNLKITGPTTSGGIGTTALPLVTAGEPVTTYATDLNHMISLAHIAGVSVQANAVTGQLTITGPNSITTSGSAVQDLDLTTTSYNFVTSNATLATVAPSTTLAVSEGGNAVTVPAFTTSQTVSTYAGNLQSALTAAGITDVTVAGAGGVLAITGPANMKITGTVNQTFSGAQSGFNFGSYTDPNTGLTVQATVAPTSSLTISGPTTAGGSTTITVAPSNPAGESVAQYALQVQNALTKANITGVTVSTANGNLSIAGPDTVTVAGTMNQDMLGTTNNYSFEANATVDPTTNLRITGQTATGGTATLTAPSVSAGETVAQYATALTAALSTAGISNVAVSSSNGQLTITGANISTTGGVQQGLADTTINYDFGSSATVNPATALTIVGPTVSGTPPTAITQAPTVTAGETVAQYAADLMKALKNASIDTGPDGVSVTATGGQLSIVGPAATLKTAGIASQDLTATTISYNFGTSGGAIATVDPKTNLTITGQTANGATSTTIAPTVTLGETLAQYVNGLTNALTTAGIAGVTVSSTAGGQLSIAGANISTAGSVIQDPVGSTNANGMLTFDSSGNLVNPSANLSNISFAGLSDSAAPMNVTWSLFGANGVGEVSQTAGESSQSAQNANGYAAGNYQKFSIGSDGTITATYSNGQNQTVGQIGLATVSNLQGLADVGSTQYQTTTASGAATVGVAGTGGLGTLEGSSLEASNVNISQEFSDLIIAQRAFEANSKAVTTFDTVTQETINMIH